MTDEPLKLTDDVLDRIEQAMAEQFDGDTRCIAAIRTLRDRARAVVDDAQVVRATIIPTRGIRELCHIDPAKLMALDEVLPEVKP